MPLSSCSVIIRHYLWFNISSLLAASAFSSSSERAFAPLTPKVIPERGFTYLGNGAVAFFAEEKDGKAAQYTITLSIEGSDVNFKVKLDPQENQ